MSFYNYAKAVKNLLEEMVQAEINFYVVPIKETYVINMNFYNVKRYVSFSLLPFYMEGVYPIVAAKAISEKAVKEIVNACLKH